MFPAHGFPNMVPPRYRAVALDGLTIVLDLERDEYLAVPQSDALTHDRLVEVALSLETRVESVRLADPQAIPVGRSDLDACGPFQSERALLLDWCRLAFALPFALWALKIGRPSAWIENNDACVADALPKTVRAARRFRSMRPYVPMLSRCLPHALLLRSYLATCGLRATLVIGVRLFPFEAHCWVQAGAVVLTDDFEQTSAYTPIAAG